MAIKKGKGSIVFDILNHLILVLIALTCILPIVYVVISSLVSPDELLARKIVLIPRKLDFSAYKYLFSSVTLLRSLGISIIITLVGTAINMVMTILAAYPLSKKRIRGRDTFIFLIVVTMVFSGGMIPTYLVVNGLHLTNTLWSIWLPGAIDTFNMIILKNFFQQIPAELEEATTIDGCNDLQTLILIILPLSIPSIATFSLFYAVGHWNAYFNAILYINNDKLWPIQVWLRQIVLLASGGYSDSTTNDVAAKMSQNIQYAVIVFATLPILFVYPFIQKYFTKGVMVGAVKG